MYGTENKNWMIKYLSLLGAEEWITDAISALPTFFCTHLHLLKADYWKYLQLPQHYFFFFFWHRNYVGLYVQQTECIKELIPFKQFSTYDG